MDLSLSFPTFLPAIPAKSGDYLDSISKQIVIPAKAGIHASYWPWIPAFAGMTSRSETVLL
ncbi:hypothetical protein [Dyella nitratireducens]|uniref:hypothetical protein n=1 Tax=Dyella nitratireducens TaxID=1849580 RepID=UPI00166922F3|nr:hypothetical protein [Dyella nitratireducens]